MAATTSPSYAQYFDVKFNGALANISEPLITANLTPQNMVQTFVMANASAISGQFRLAFNGTPGSSQIVYSSTPATLQASILASLQSIPAIGATGVTVNVSADATTGATFTVTYTGLLADSLQSALTVFDSSLSPAGTTFNGVSGTSGQVGNITTPGIAGLLGKNGPIVVTEPSNGVYIVTSTGPLAGADQTFAAGTLVAGVTAVGVTQTSDEQSFTASAPGGAGGVGTAGGGFALTFNGVATSTLNFNSTVLTATETGTVTGGTFTLTATVNGVSQTTGAIQWNAPATGAGSVQTALQALTTLTGASTATVSAAALGGPYVITWGGSSVNPTIVATSSLTGTTPGMAISGAVPPTAAAVATALNGLSTINANGGGVNVYSLTPGSYVIQFTGVLATAGQSFMTATASAAAVTLTQPGLSAVQYGNVAQDTTVGSSAPPWNSCPASAEVRSMRLRLMASKKDLSLAALALAASRPGPCGWTMPPERPRIPDPPSTWAKLPSARATA